MDRKEQIGEKNHMVYYGYPDCTHIFEMGFIVRSFKKLASRFKAGNPRVVLGIPGRIDNFSILKLQAPTKDTIEEEKDEFYDLLDTALDFLRHNNIKLIAGDLKAKVKKKIFISLPLVNIV